MKSAQILKEKINSGTLTLGLLATNHFWIDLIEIARNAGLDYVIIDLEHNAFAEEMVSDACSLGRLIDFPILIRPQASEITYVRRAADKGACGFLLPTVEDAATLDQVRDALYMPPRGKRRPGGPGNRWTKNFNTAGWQEAVENDFIVLPQIENQRGLDNAAAIARHEITTAMAIGPYDLSADLGVCWDPTNAKLIAAQDHIRAAGRAVGKNMWMIGDGATLVKRGFNFLCIGEPSGFLEAMLRTTTAAVRAGHAPAPGSVKMDKVD